MSDDLFSQLLSYQWRNIEFPCASFDVDITQDHAEHKWPDRDGAHIEATGRNPLVFTAKAIFRRGTASGKNESFVGGEMYPTRYRDFLAACADRTSGELQHPELGKRIVKCKSFKTHWDATKRDGVDVDVVWVETNDPTTEKLGVLGSESPIPSAIAVAAGLDQALQQYAISHPFELPKTSISSFIQGIKGLGDQFELFQKKIAGQVDAVIFQLDALSDKVAKTKDVKTWPIVQTIEHLRSVLHDIKKGAQLAVHPVSLYVVPQTTTLSAICALLGSGVQDVLKLNPDLSTSAIVKQNTVVRYYTNTKDQS